MAHRANRISDAIQSHDYMLYAKDDGRAIRIYRKGYEARPEVLSQEIKITNIVRNDHLVMSLTDTWGVNGNRVDWGIEPIMARLKALDLWNSSNVATEFVKQEEESEKSRGRDLRNSTESFLYDFKDKFAKATNDINVSGLSKRVNKQL